MNFSAAIELLRFCLLDCAGRHAHSRIFVYGIPAIAARASLTLNR